MKTSGNAKILPGPTKYTLILLLRVELFNCSQYFRLFYNRISILNTQNIKYPVYNSEKNPIATGYKDPCFIGFLSEWSFDKALLV